MTESSDGHDAASETKAVTPRIWVQPTLSRLCAGSAEDGVGAGSDTFQNPS